MLAPSDYSSSTPFPFDLFTSGDPVRERRARQVSHFQANGEIYAPGDPVGAFYRVEFGAVRLYRLLADGRRQIIGFYLAGEVFGFEADDVHGFFAEAVCSSGIRQFPLPPDGEMASSLLSIALQALVRAQEHMLVIGRQNAAERVAAFLIDMSERQGDSDQVELAMSRTDIGDYLGLTIETVSRVFSRLRETGHIELLNSRTVRILRPDALRALCE